MPPPLSRRRTLALGLALSATTSVALVTLAPQSPVQAGRASSIDLETASIPQLRTLLDRRQVTSEQLTRAYLDRITLLNTDGPSLNAVRALNPQAVSEARELDRQARRGATRGPMYGIPVLVKDNIDVAGMPTTAGSIALQGSVPVGDAPLVTQLRASGAVILGKTNLSEFANFTTAGMPSGYSSLGGQVLNPYDASQTPSGSSSGSGVAAATGLAAVTVGTETSGSILSPAAANSLAAVKPTVGLISRTGVIPISATQDTAGPMTKTVYDSAALLSAMTGVDPQDPATAPSAPYVGTDYTRTLSTEALQGKRLGYVAPPTAPNEQYVAALDALRAQGATLVPVTVAGVTAPGILSYEFKRDLNAYFDRLPPQRALDTLTEVVAFNQGQARLKFGQTLLVESEAIDLEDPATKATYQANRNLGLAQSRTAIDSVLTANNLDAIVSAQSTTGVGARAGYPTVIVPSGYGATNGRPTGLSFLGTAFDEADLLAYAYDYEQATMKRRPPSVINPTLFQCLAVATGPQASCAP